MGWFDDQVRERKKHDEEMFAESIADIAGAIVGGKMSAALKNDSQVTRDAIGEILNFYNVKMKEIPENITDLNAQLEFYLRPNGIVRRNINLDDGWYKEATGAILGTRKEDGLVVAFIPGRFGGYSFYNRDTGKREKVDRKNQKLFDVEALAFYMPFPLKKLNISDLVKYMAGQISTQDITFAVAFMAMSSLVGLMMPKINSMMFGVVLESRSNALLFAVALLFVATSVSQILFGANNAIISARISTKLDMSINGATMMRIMSLPADFFKKYSAGELTSYSGYMSSLCNMLVGLIFNVGLSSIFSLVYISSIFKYAPALVAPAVTIVIITVCLSLASSFMQMSIDRKKMELSAKESGLSYALISGVQKIKLSGAEKRAFAKWASLYAQEAKLEYNPRTFIKINGTLSLAITSIGTIIMYFIAQKSGVSVSEYFAFDIAYGMMSGAFLGLSAIAVQISQIKPILNTVKPIMDIQPEVSADKQYVSHIKGEIELNNISFKYSEDMPNVIDNLSLKIKPGQYVAIVGKTGCGKSTLVRLLLGFEKPQKGAIYYDHKDMNTLDLKSLRQNIGVVLQNGSLFNDDIFSNITISAPWLNLDEAWEAAEIAGIADDIRRMPMGMFTIIGEGSGGISGGQKQRIMIARAIAPKPRILIFDEATSALDNVTQKKVSNALDAMKCTRIVIAHRLSTIKQCDRIIYLEDGCIKEDGSFEELMEKNGYFADLVKRQQIDLDAKQTDTE